MVENQKDLDVETGGFEPEDEFASGYVSTIGIGMRQAFIRKVYFVLLCQLLTTIAISAYVMLSPTATSFVQANVGLLWTSMFGGIGVLLVLMCVRQNYPLNIILLGVWTLMESYVVATVVSIYDAKVVLEAFILTAGVFIGLTLYTLQTQKDFSFLGAGLFSVLLVLIFAGFIQLFFPFSHTVSVVYSIVAAILFSFFILYDTSRLITVHSVDEWLFASINLYLDIINLFLNVLNLIGGTSRN